MNFYETIFFSSDKKCDYAKEDFYEEYGRILFIKKFPLMNFGTLLYMDNIKRIF